MLAKKLSKKGTFRKTKLNAVSPRPMGTIWAIMDLLTMLSSRRRGGSDIYRSWAGSLPSMMAPKPSITRFTNSRWVTFRGSSTPKKGAIALTTTAATLMTSWNLQNFRILW